MVTGVQTCALPILEFGVPDLVEEVSKKATSDWSAVSSEKLAELDAD